MKVKYFLVMEKLDNVADFSIIDLKIYCNVLAAEGFKFCS